MVATMTAKKAPVKKPTVKFSLDCTKVMHDNILDLTHMAHFFSTHVKIDGKINNLGEKIQVSRDKGRICINAELPFSKRYIKYLAKRYLKKQQVRDFLRVVATNKTNYELRYLSMANDEEAAN